MSDLHLTDPADTVKMLRETFCVAQQLVNSSALYRRGEHGRRLQRLIDECDRQRPLGPDGKHGDRHTPTCGCEANHHARHHPRPVRRSLGLSRAGMRERVARLVGCCPVRGTAERGAAVSDDRVRLSVLADELGVDFGGLFGKFCETFPEHIDDDLTVPAQWGPVLERLREEVAA